MYHTTQGWPSVNCEVVDVEIGVLQLGQSFGDAAKYVRTLKNYSCRPQH
jgi:hypothetical protein